MAFLQLRSLERRRAKLARTLADLATSTIAPGVKERVRLMIESRNARNRREWTRELAEMDAAIASAKPATKDGDRMHEQERLLLHVQEAMAEAIERSGRTRAEVATRAGYRWRSAITNYLIRDNLTLRTVATVAHAAGFRLVVKLEKLEGE
jgi:hypothetical protein